MHFAVAYLLTAKRRTAELVARNTTQFRYGHQSKYQDALNAVYRRCFTRTVHPTPNRLFPVQYKDIGLQNLIFFVLEFLIVAIWYEIQWVNYKWELSAELIILLIFLF